MKQERRSSFAPHQAVEVPFTLRRQAEQRMRRAEAADMTERNELQQRGAIFDFARHAAHATKADLAKDRAAR
jgi:hypothetical protein